MESVLTRNQKIEKIYQTSEGRMIVNIRYDDECGNGHNTFAITGEIGGTRQNPDMCGCIHDEIAEHAPELAHLIKWHLVSSDGPMHYVANTLYHASEKDCHGLLKGEKQIISYAHYLQVNNSPYLHKLDKRLKAFIDSTGMSSEAWEQVQIEKVPHKDDPS